MEFLNRVELVGVVGSIRKQKVSDQTVANFSVVTEQYYKDKSGSAVVEATWFNIVAWQNNNMPDLERIDRGSHVHIQGRIRVRRYTSESGEPRSTFEVVATNVQLQS